MYNDGYSDGDGDGDVNGVSLFSFPSHLVVGQLLHLDDVV